MRFLISIFLLFTLAACGAPKFSGRAIQDTDASILIIEDNATRSGFLQAMESWMSKNGYQYDVAQEGSRHDPDQITLEYKGHWAWDLALYLKDARIEAFNNGQRVGDASYLVPTVTGNFGKFSVAEERIQTMLDLLFGKISVKEANQTIHKQN